MPRIRTIKPDFWKHEDLSEMPPETHMMAAALLNYADDEGYFNANPKLVKADCCPLREDSTNVRRSLEQLYLIGYIDLGECEDGKRWGRVRKFCEHQRVDRPRDSKIKDLNIEWESSTKNRRRIDEGSALEGNGMEGNGSNTSGKPDPCRTVFEYWQEVMGHPKAKLDDKRKRRVSARLKDGYTVDELKQATDGCKKSPHNMGENDTGTVYDDLELICRDAAHVDRFIAMAEGRGLKDGKQEPRPPHLRALK